LSLLALACGSIIVLVAGTNYAAPPGRSVPCASGFKQVNESAEMYRCEIAGSAERICLSGWLESPVIDVEKVGNSGWKIIYRCGKKSA
jgi:hypothetical protein